MSKKIAPRVQLNFAPDEPEHISDEEGLISDEELDLPCEVPYVIERKEIVENDIFDNINPSVLFSFLILLSHLLSFSFSFSLQLWHVLLRVLSHVLKRV